MANYPLAEIEDAISGAMVLLPAMMDTQKARVQMRGIALQEGFSKGQWHRFQVLNDGSKGPARGGWQFERGGGVKGVLTHPSSKRHAQSICLARGVEADPRSVWSALETDDILAAAFARLLLWTDQAPLPAIGATDDAWECYIRNWRPGRPHYDTWADRYKAAMNYGR
jgi:hypothetical protein